MRVAVVGSRNLIVNNLEDYLPEETTEIVSGGARGIDTCARKYALKNNIRLTDFCRITKHMAELHPFEETI